MRRAVRREHLLLSMGVETRQIHKLPLQEVESFPPTGHEQTAPHAEHGRDESPLSAAVLTRFHSTILTRCFEGIQSTIIDSHRNDSYVPRMLPLAARYVFADRELALSGAYYGLRDVFGVPAESIFPHWLDGVISAARAREPRGQDIPRSGHGIIFIADAHKALDYPAPGDAVFDAACTQFAPPLCRPGIYHWLINHDAQPIADGLHLRGHVFIPHTAEGEVMLRKLITAYTCTHREERPLLAVTREDFASSDAPSLIATLPEPTWNGAGDAWSARSRLRSQMLNPSFSAGK